MISPDNCLLLWESNHPIILILGRSHLILFLFGSGRDKITLFYEIWVQYNSCFYRARFCFTQFSRVRVVYPAYFGKLLNQRNIFDKNIGQNIWIHHFEITGDLKIRFWGQEWLIRPKTSIFHNELTDNSLRKIVPKWRQSQNSKIEDSN